MTETVRQNYLNWLYDQVCDDSYTRGLSYSKLFTKLFNTEFYWLIDHDENRASDGINLRYIFGEKYQYSDEEIDYAFDGYPCNVLEVLVALAIRCEQYITEDDNYGNRTGQWFWTMIVNIGLGDMSDSKFSERRADRMLNVFLNRTYRDNHIGCPFFVEHPKRPLRDTELWMQLNWYLSEIL